MNKTIIEIPGTIDRNDIVIRHVSDDVVTPPTPDARLMVNMLTVEPVGHWERTPDGLIWKGPNLYKDPGRDPLTLRFNIAESGQYDIFCKSRAVDAKRSDLNNDSWFRFANGGELHQWRKGYIVDKKDGWGTRVRFEVGKDKKHIRLNLSAGLHEMQISGRSYNHEIANVELRKVGAVVDPGPDVSPIGDNDLISIHGDFAPDRDDGHAAVAIKIILDYFGIADQAHFVCGTYNLARKRHFKNPADVLNATFDASWWDAHNNRDQVIEITARLWDTTIANGGHVYVAEGGPSEFTASVLRVMQENRKNVTIIQHSVKNEEETPEDDLIYVKHMTNYIKVGDGNRKEGTADLNSTEPGLVKKFLAHPVYGPMWKAAFDYYDPTKKLDGSDAVAMLEIGKVKDVKDWSDFYRVFMQ